jgi:hypothetical protein
MLEFALICGTAALTHLLMSFCQTFFHYRLGHRRLGGRLFRNHISFHHVYYAKDHLVSNRYLADKGNNTPSSLSRAPWPPSESILFSRWIYSSP